MARVGGFPTGLAVDAAHDTVYVASGDANSLSMIDTRTCNASTTRGCAAATTVATGGQDPIGVVVDEATGTVYAVNGGSDTVAVIDADTCNASDHAGCGHSPALVTVPGGPEFLALDAATDTVYVADTVRGRSRSSTAPPATPGPPRVAPARPYRWRWGPGAFPIAVDQEHQFDLRRHRGRGGGHRRSVL